MIMLIVIVTGCLAGLLIGALSTLWINHKTEKEVIDEMSAVLAEALVIARKEIYFRPYGFSPSECNEMHLPGDCPLCGAS